MSEAAGGYPREWHDEIDALAATPEVLAAGIPEDEVRDYLRRAVEYGRVGKRRVEVEDVARILIDHGLFSVSTGGQRAVDARIAALPTVTEARRSCDEDTAPLVARRAALETSDERLGRVMRAQEHSPLVEFKGDEGMAYSLNLSIVAREGRLWRAEEQARQAWLRAHLPAIERVAREEAARLLRERGAPS